MSNRRIVIPGGAGLVGQNLVAGLLAAGHRNLVVIDKHHANLEILRRVQPQITCVESDLADRGDWEEHLEGATDIVMLQAQIGGNDPAAFVRNNVDSTRNVLAAAHKYEVPYLVHVSSSVVESAANDDYTNTKKQQEEMVLSDGMPCVVLRPTLMFGWFDRKHLGWLSRFMQKVPVFPIPGSGRYMRQPLFAGDFSRIIMSCLENRIQGKTYNISGRERIDYVDMIREIRQANGAKTPLVHIPVGAFSALLRTWALFDKDPPFTAAQLKALVAHDEFEEIDWPRIFGVAPTSFATAIRETFNHPTYSKVVLEF